jgi:hypothetical protein
MSVSFYPPSQEYVPLEEIVKKMPDFAYQIFFADPTTTKKIEDNVTPPSLFHLVKGLTVSEYQIEIFYRILFTVPGTTIGSFSDFVRILNGEVKVEPSVVKTDLSDEVCPAQ